MTVVVLLKPIERGAALTSGMDFRWLMVLILIAIFGPVLIPMLVHNVAAPFWFPGMGQAALVMVIALIGIGLFFQAVLSQAVKSPPQASVSMVQGSLTMNSHPKQVMDELERHLQSNWVASLPNRRYIKRIPEVDINNKSGSFEGELLEETQPVQSEEIKSMTWRSSFSNTRYCWLSWLNMYGVVLMALASVLLLAFSQHMITTQGTDSYYTAGMTLGVSFWIMGGFCFRAGSVIWGRFDFISRLIWVEMKGNYQAAQMDYGSQFTDRIKTQKQVISVEAMTLRVWMAEIGSVAFGKDSPRNIISMIGLKDAANTLHEYLCVFGQQQSMIVAPTSVVDFQRSESLAAINAVTHQQHDVKSLPETILGSLQGTSVAAGRDLQPGQSPEEVCSRCAPAMQDGMKFCPDCGKRLVAS